MAKPVMAEGVSSAEQSLFVAFADAVSGGDVAAVSLAREFVTTPPETLETIGFYSMENAPPASRALRGIISHLGNEGFMIDMDPSYILLDFAPLLRSEGAVAEGAVLPDMLSMLPDEDMRADDEGRVNEGHALNAAIATFANATDAAIVQNGMEVLEVTLKSGDARFYWVTTQEVASTWRFVILLNEERMWGPPGIDEIRVRPISWAAFRDDTFRSVGLNPAEHPNDLELPNTLCALPQV